MSILNIEGKKKAILNMPSLDKPIDVVDEPPMVKTRRGKSAESYRGILQLNINEGVELTEEAQYFVNFLEGLGQSGHTFEELFEKVKTSDDPEVTYATVTHKFYTIRAKGTMSFKWLTKIAGLLGYEAEVNFMPKPNPESFKEEIPIEKGMYEDIIDLD